MSDNSFDDYDKYFKEISVDWRDENLTQKCVYLIGLGIYAKGRQQGFNEGVTWLENQIKKEQENQND